MQEQGSLKLESTADQRTPLRQAVSALVGLRGISYSDAYKMVHQWFGVSAIEDIPVDVLPAAVEYVHRLTLSGVGATFSENEGIRDKFTAKKLFYRKIILNKPDFILFFHAMMTRQKLFQYHQLAGWRVCGIETAFGVSSWHE